MLNKISKIFDNFIIRFKKFNEQNRSGVVLFIVIYLISDFINEYYFQATGTHLPFKVKLFLLWALFLFIFKVKFIASFYVALCLLVTVPFLWIFNFNTFAATNAAFSFLFLVFGFMHRFVSSPLNEE